MISPQLRPATSGLARTDGVGELLLQRPWSRRRTPPRRRGCRGRARRPRPPCARPWSGVLRLAAAAAGRSPGRAGTATGGRVAAWPGSLRRRGSSTPRPSTLRGAFAHGVHRGSVRRRKDDPGSVQTPRTDAANTGKTRQKGAGSQWNSHRRGIAQDVHAAKALSIRRRFTTPGVHPFDTVEWELRDARIGHGDKVAFEQTDVEFPTTWSQNATNIVAQKYFRGQLSSPARERSVKQMIGRVAGTIADWGRSRGYFATAEDGDSFEAELTYVLLHQMAAFNSPVWFNCGWHPGGQPQEPDVGLLHPLGRRLDGVDPRLEHEGGPDLPRRLGLGDQPLEDPWIDGAAEQGRHGERARCRSCAAPMRGRARSSRAAARGGRRRWSCSTSTTPTSASSSGARPRRRTRPLPCATPASTCRSTARASTRSSTRTRTTRSASTTTSCAPSRTTRTGT